MKLLEYQIEINSSSKDIWHKMWDKESYKLWASERAADHYYEGTLEEGNIIDLYDPQGNGMFNLVEKHIPEKEISFKHLGWIYDRVRTPQNWENSRETYLIESTENGSVLKFSVNALDEFADYFQSNVPHTLQRIKEISEKE